MRLCVLHNLYFYNTMMEEIRDAIDAGNYQNYKAEKLYAWNMGSKKKFTRAIRKTPVLGFSVVTLLFLLIKWRSLHTIYPINSSAYDYYGIIMVMSN